MYLSRHSDMIRDVNMGSQIMVVGAGAIGSYTVLALAKLGFTNIIVADDGIIEEENIAPQFYRPKDIGKLKVECLKRIVKEHTKAEIIGVPARITELNYQFITGARVLILAVDSMEARKGLYFMGNGSVTIVVDARMAIEFLTVISYGADFENFKAYRTSLHSDEDSVQEACTNKAISYTSMIAGGLVAKTVLDGLKKSEKGEPIGYQTVNFDINNFDMVRLC